MKHQNVGPISCVIPTRNGERVIAETLVVISEWLSELPGSEILILENGSTEESIAELKQIIHTGRFSVPIRLYVVENYGEAIRQGVKFSQNNRIVLSADDLPFGLQDWDGFNLSITPVSIAAKLRQVDGIQSLFRWLLSYAFKVLRLAILGIKNEVNGTIQLQGDSLSMVDRTTEKSMAVTLELMYLLQKKNFQIAEIPVQYRQGSHKSRVHPIRDPLKTLWLLFKLRKRFP